MPTGWRCRISSKSRVRSLVVAVVGCAYEAQQTRHNSRRERPRLVVEARYAWQATLPERRARSLVITRAQRSLGFRKGRTMCRECGSSAWNGMRRSPLLPPPMRYLNVKASAMAFSELREAVQSIFDSPPIFLKPGITCLRKLAVRGY